MKTDQELLNELKVFAKQFDEEYNILSYEDGAYYNALGNGDIDENDWLNSETLREEFETWVVDNNLNLPNMQINISFGLPSIREFGLIKEIK